MSMIVKLQGILETLKLRHREIFKIISGIMTNVDCNFEHIVQHFEWWSELGFGDLHHSGFS